PLVRGHLAAGPGRSHHVQEGDVVPDLVPAAQDAGPGGQDLGVDLPPGQRGPRAPHGGLPQRGGPARGAAGHLRSDPGGPGESHRRGTERQPAYPREPGWAARGQTSPGRGQLHRLAPGIGAAMSDRPRVLVVDDEMGPRESLRMILKPRYEIATAESGEAALKTLGTFHPDLIFMDIKMPQMDGIELLRRIKGTDPSIEVVMITAYASLETVKNALTHGAFEYLIKPFSRQDLEATAKRARARRRPQRGARSQLNQLVDQMRSLQTKLDDREEQSRREQAEQSLRVTQLSILREISRTIVGQLDTATLIESITNQLHTALGYDSVTIAPDAPPAV